MLTEFFILDLLSNIGIREIDLVIVLLKIGLRTKSNRERSRDREACIGGGVKIMNTFTYLLTHLSTQFICS